MNPYTVMIICVGMIISHYGYAQTNNNCFIDENSAYAYLLNQQIKQKNALKLAENSEKININQASEAQLVSLKGIGSKKAQAVIAYRQASGGFRRVDDLTKVKGIGKKTVEKNRQRLSVN